MTKTNITVEYDEYGQLSFKTIFSCDAQLVQFTVDDNGSVTNITINDDSTSK